MGALMILADLEPVEALLAELPKLRACCGQRVAAAAAALDGLAPDFKRDGAADAE